AVIADEDIRSNGVTIVRVQDSLKALAYVAVRFWDNPSGVLRMVGITGTNGKTTTCYLLESIFTAAGWPTGVMGTINYHFANEKVPAPNTTPLASELQRFLAKIVQQGGKTCVMEVSSHALELGRVQGVDFDVAVFTDRTQDRLPFHNTMDPRAGAKATLFSSAEPTAAKTFPMG